MKKYFIFLILFCLIFSGCANTNGEVKNNVEIAVNDIVINKSHAYVDKGDKIILLAQVFPFNSDNQKIHWKSDNPNVASVNDGIVVGKNEGRTVITATSDDGEISANCIVYVSSPKLDYEKYENNINFENQNARDNNFISSFNANKINNNFNNNFYNQINAFYNSIKSIESLFDNIKLDYEIVSKKINKENTFANFVGENILNKNKDKNSTSNLSAQSEDEKSFTMEQNKNEKNKESDLTNKNENYIYSYQYYYNSNGLNGDVLEDENTVYKDENTIIKEKVQLL